jgi:phosphate transport system substrate-binding protein
MIRKNTQAWTLVAGMAALLGLAQVKAAPLLINGAGATFPFPLYSKWFSEYRKVDPAVEINYQSVGSGAGIRQFLDRTVDFGASDAPMTDDQLKKAGETVVHVPLALGAVVVTYNLPGVTSLEFDGATLADIFLGKVIYWDDARLKTLNPKAILPHTAIVVAHRSDGSGTTSIFADYLAKVSPEWKDKVGVGTALKWPVGLGGKGNEGVTGLVKQTPGAIGYVELIYARQNKLPVAAMKNAAGKAVEPSVKSVTAAAAGALKDIPADFRASITNASGAGAYPISGMTYVLVYGKMPKEKGAPIVAFLNWALTLGQKIAEPLDYAPLPASLIKKVQAAVKGIQLQ